MILSTHEKMILAYALEQELGLPGLEDLLHEQFYKSQNEDYCGPLLNIKYQQVSCVEDLPNNGRAHSLNPGWIIYDNFRFRHESECYVYQAYKNQSIPITPLPVWSYKNTQLISCRREPDLMSLHEGQYVCLEIDGASHNGKTRADETDRCSMLLDAGANFIHIVHRSSWTMHWANLYRNICVSISNFTKVRGLIGHEFYLDFKVEHLLHQYDPLPIIYDHEREELNEPTKVYILGH